MTIEELAKKMELKSLTKISDREIEGVFISDMISDVMAGAKSGNLWLTIQTHKSIVPAANLVDVSAIIITGNKEVPADTLEMANKYNIAIFSSTLPTYEIVGTIHRLDMES